MDVLVLQDHYQSEYTWAAYQEAVYPMHHPGHHYFISGVLKWHERFGRWLDGWDVRTVDLEQLEEPLDLRGVDLVILDDVRQSVSDPYELALMEYVRQGGHLIVYAGRWGLGGRPNDEYTVRDEVDSYEKSFLAELLPVKILRTPDRVWCEAEPVLLDEFLSAGIETRTWRIFAYHEVESLGRTQAQIEGEPLIVSKPFGRGHVLVYTGDDLAWIDRGASSDTMGDYYGALWRRLVALVRGSEPESIPAERDEAVVLERPPAYAHPDQPINFLWTGYLPYSGEKAEQAIARDLLEHSVSYAVSPPGTLPEAARERGVRGTIHYGCPILNPYATKDPETAVLDASGKGDPGLGVCVNNPRALAYMDRYMEETTRSFAEDLHVAYGHMGDETEFGDCFCEHCRKAFEDQFGGEMPVPGDDLSPESLDRWIDYAVFRNRSIGRMYARAIEAAHRVRPDLRMYASLPQSGGMTHGSDIYHTQASFDLLWDHPYPGTMALRVGLNAALNEETALLQGRPYVPILGLLQGFDAYDRAPHMPPKEYIREMTWQAIAHGTDSVGWFVYSAFFWNLPGTEAWAEAGRLAREVLEPLTPTLYAMVNDTQPVGLIWSCSQEAVDGLKERVLPEDDPWKSVVRWYALHATQEAYEILKHAHVPTSVFSEYRLWEEHAELPFEVIVIPYVEHLHPKSIERLETFMASGGKVLAGANSTLALEGIQKLPFSFDAKFTTWWPKDRQNEWNQRRARQYVISLMLERTRHLPPELLRYRDRSIVDIDDPEVVYNIRTAGEAKYVFVINDRQRNPLSPELRRKRQGYNHFMLLPAEFPSADPEITFRGEGYLYELTDGKTEPRALNDQGITSTRPLAGGEGKVFLILPDRIRSVRIADSPIRTRDGVHVQAVIEGANGPIRAALPLKIDFTAGSQHQTVYATTEEGRLDWAVPFLKDFPPGAIAVTVTDIASGTSTQTEAETRGRGDAGTR